MLQWLLKYALNVQDLTNVFNRKHCFSKCADSALWHQSGSCKPSAESQSRKGSSSALEWMQQQNIGSVLLTALMHFMMVSALVHTCTLNLSQPVGPTCHQWQARPSWGVNCSMVYLELTVLWIRDSILCAKYRVVSKTYTFYNRKRITLNTWQT